MILNLDNPVAQDRYIPDVKGFQFSILMPDPYAAKAVRKSPVKRPGSIGRLGRVGRLGATYTYCDSNPPDAATQKMLADRGDTVNITHCDYSTGGPGETGFVTGSAPSGSPSYPGAAPVYAPAAIPACSPLDIACVAQASAIQTQNEIDYGVKQADYNRQVCLADGNPADVCMARWPVGYSGNVPATNLTPQQAALNTNETVTAYDFTPLYQGGPVPLQFEPNGMAQQPKPNQSVPPTTQLTTIPTLPGAPSTRQVLTSAYASGSAQPNGAPAPSQLIAGIDNKTLLLGAAALALLMVVKK